MPPVECSAFYVDRNCGCPTQFKNQIDDTYYYYCVKCNVLGNTGGVIGAGDGIAPSNVNTQPHYCEQPDIQCGHCEGDDGQHPPNNCIPLGIFGSAGMPLAAGMQNPQWSASNLRTYHGATIAQTGATHYVGDPAWKGSGNSQDPRNGDTKGEIHYDEKTMKLDGPTKAWFWDALSQHPARRIGVKLWKLTPIGGGRSMCIGLQFAKSELDPEHQVQVYPAGRDRHHHLVYRIIENPGQPPKFDTYSILTHHSEPKS
jgi:hypothetical protein